MKRKLWYVLLAAEAVLCAVLVFAGEPSGAVITALAFPFAQLGRCLRALSLAGGFGNAAAVVLYAALSLLPAGYLLYAREKRGLRAEDALMGLLSVLLFAVLYLMANEGRLAALLHGGGELLTVSRAVLGGTVYAVLAGYAVLRVLRAAMAGSTDRLYRLLGLLCAFLAFVFVFAIFAVRIGELMTSFASLRAGNIGSEGGLGISYAFLVLKFLTDALPWALNIGTALIGMGLLSEMRADRYSEAALKAAHKLSRWCVRSLAAVVLTNILFNVLQLVFGAALRTVSGSLVIPADSIAFALLALLFARLTGESRALKEDNELII